MKPSMPYLSFNGNCREAMTFYQGVFNAEKLELTTFKDASEHMPEAMVAEMENQVMHSSIQVGDFCLMASDCPAEYKANFGNNISITLTFTSLDEQKQLFNKLAQDGKITMPLGDTFWGAHFGMLEDKFGINWMFYAPLNQQAQN